jgi:hypothetical protein
VAATEAVSVVIVAATEAVSVVIVAVKEVVCVVIVVETEVVSVVIAETEVVSVVIAETEVVSVVIVETEAVSVVIVVVREVDVVEEVVDKAHHLLMRNHKFKNVAAVAEELVEEQIWPGLTPLPLQEVVEMVATEKDASTIERAVSEESLSAFLDCKQLINYEIMKDILPRFINGDLFVSQIS